MTSKPEQPGLPSGAITLDRISRARERAERTSARERVMTAVALEEPDRVPIDLWVASEVKQYLAEHFGQDYDALLDLLGVDFRVVQGPKYVGPELVTQPNGLRGDVWGVLRQPVTYGLGERKGIYLEVASSPLAHMTTAREVEEYTGWPSPDWWDYSGIADECRRHAGKCVVYAGDRLDRTAQLKTAMYLRGVEQILVDLALNPGIVESIVERITVYLLEYNRRVFQAAAQEIDIFMMGDDFGMQTGLFMSPEKWKRFFSPGFRQFIALAHEYGVKAMHHTCGAVEPLIPEFIDAGLDILQALQPRAAGMDLAGLKKKYGRHLCLHGSMDIQQTMPYGSPQDVRREVQERMEVGKPGGGFIICTAHNLQLDVPTENIVALLEAYHEHAPY